MNLNFDFDTIVYLMPNRSSNTGINAEVADDAVEMRRSLDGAALSPCPAHHAQRRVSHLTTPRQFWGVRVDDFGTGYSSLSNLRAFPFDKIKIDSSFIKAVNVNEQAAAIVRSVLGLGRALNLPVLAEGVETAAEFAFLEGELCNEVQGYLLGRPADIESFRQLTHGGDVTEQSSVVVPLVAKASSK